VAFGFGGGKTIEGDKMPEKATIPSTDILGKCAPASPETS
jgi:hypothetical protein